MAPDQRHPALDRIVGEHGAGDLLDTLSDRLPGADLTTVLLAATRARAHNVTPGELLDRYGHDRFVTPGSVNALDLHETEGLALRTVAERFTPIVLAPLVPFATHAALAGVAQDNVISTVRRTEVAADPTTALALEAASRRSDAPIDASTATTRLAGISRVVRAQRFEGPRSFQHFSLLGLVSAGRDHGNRSFETDELVRHVTALADVARIGRARALHVRLTDFTGGLTEVLDAAAERVGASDLVVERWPERDAGRAYYEGICFKLAIVDDRDEVEVGDGGFVDWTQRLLGNRKERLMTSAVSTERLAMLGG